MKRLVLLSISMLLIFFCEFKGNIYNPGDSAYKQPSFTLDTSSNVSDGDTILTDTLRMVLIGNDKERHYNLFRYSLDGSSWTKWKGKGEKEYVIEHSPITGGFHTVTIEYCYPDQEDRAKDSTITFFRAVKPEITEMTDTLFDVELGVSCTLRVAAQGTGDLGYEWFCDNNRIDSATSDSLFLNPVFVEDTAHRWYCSISNNWGEITSPEIRLQILLRVFYDGNGNTSGEVPEDTGRYAINGLVEIPGNPGKLTRRGYTFKGWNTEEDGSGVSPDSGLMLKIGTENITLYARWQPNDSFTVTYDGNGAQEGEVPETERYYKTGELVTVAGNSGDLRREGYTFIGWNTLANDSGKGYLEGDTFEMGEKTVILYAQWTSNPAWKVTYDANGAESGNVPEDENKYEEGDTVTVAFNSGNLEKEGNIFVGWSTQTDGDKEPFFTPGATFLMGTDDVKLYACWTTKPTFKLIYDGNGNTGGSSPHTVSQEEGKTVNIAGSGELFKKGYNFSGWNTKADGTGKEYNENDSYTMPAKHDTLYAQWEKKLYTVTYDGNGDNVDNVPQSTNHLYDTEITLDTKVPVRTGYTFFRWNTDSSGNGVDYKPGDKFTIVDNNIKFYAKWTVNEYSITYDGNGNDGEVFLNTVKTDYNESVTIADKGDLQKTGYSFKEWNTKADGSGTTYPADTIILMGADDINLYAKWILNEYDVIYEGNGSTSGSVPAEKWKYEDNVVVAAKENLVRTGYTFIG